MRRELRAMLSLSAPVILSELAWILMGIVDTIVVGPLGPAAIGAVGTGSTVFFSVVVLGMGTLFALDTYVGQAFGGGRVEECHRWLVAGAQLALVLSIVLVAIGLSGVALLPRVGLHPDVLVLLQPYLGALMWSVPPLLAFTVFRRYLQAMNVVRPIMFVVVAANAVNLVANVGLVYGRWGLPALGVAGSAYATLAARVFMAGALLAVIIARERRTPSGWRNVSFALDVARMGQLVRVGVPAALQIMLEVGVFAAVSLIAGSITPLAVAANQVVLNIAGFVFMIPYGISSAAAVRVGQAVGRGDRHGVRLAGWSALGLGWACALAMSLLFAIAPEPLLRLFTNDTGVLATGMVLLRLCAVFFPFDTSQTIMTGALRGLGETRWPMAVNLVGHWGIGLPAAWFLCFHRGWGVAGLWAGLTAGIITIGIGLIVIWGRMTRMTSKELPCAG
jgi:MATE family multidrug resistance protein